MICNQIDLGGSHPWAMPIDGVVVQLDVVEGGDTIVTARAALEEKQTVTFSLRAWQALGGQAAFSVGATRYLLKQMRELARNRDQQPVYIQWTATAETGAPLNASDLDDGWYVIDSFAPDYFNYVVTGIVQCSMTVTKVAAAPPRRVALAYAGGALASNFSGTPVNLISLPLGSSSTSWGGGQAFARTGAEGGIPCIQSPAPAPYPFTLDTTVANIFKGGVHVYDTINTGANGVPVAGGFVNANWVEVFGTDHDFVGDCVITNGFQLLLIQTGVAQLATAYFWNTAIATPAWNAYVFLNYFDNGGNGGTLRSYSLTRVGPEEVAIALIEATSGGGNSVLETIRLQRGRIEARIDIKAQTQANAVQYLFRELLVSGSFKIAYNESAITDMSVGLTTPPPSSTYGYAAAFGVAAGNALIGFLYQNAPAGQPNPASATAIDLGDTSGPALNTQRSYAFFAIPYGVSGSYSTANLQSEAESGTLGTGWTSQANAAASGGNEAKCASGTLAGNSDNIFQNSFVPAAGVYDVWFRVKVTSAAGAAAEMQLGLWNLTDSVWMGSTTYKANQVTTAYAWYKVAAGITPTAGKSMGPRALTALTLGTDWFIDEVAIVPKTLTADNRGPQDLWQQFMYDRSVRMVRQ